MGDSAAVFFVVIFSVVIAQWMMCSRAGDAVDELKAINTRLYQLESCKPKP